MWFPVGHFLGSQRNGANHVSMNLGNFDRVAGPVRGTNYPTYSDKLLDWYQASNMKSVRLLFTWEAVQSTLGGPVPATAAGYADYWSDLASVITRLLSRDIYVILAPWQYNAKSGDTDIVYDSATFTSISFGDFWGKFADAINGLTGADQRVAFDLINEPHTHAESGNKPGDIGISLSDWFADAQAAISGIRTAGAKNTIFVPGMAYTAAESFATNGSSTAWLRLVDPQNDLAVSVHCYSGLGSGSPTVLRDACAALVTWARANGVKVNVGEIALDTGPNGLPAHKSTFALAQAQWADWNRFCVANDDVLVGWNWWGNSAPGWWDQDDSSGGQHWGLTLDDGTTQTVYMDLIGGSLAVPMLYIRDNLTDPGAEPNTTTSRAWESPDAWVRQANDGVTVGEPILGGQPAFVYVSVTNRGKGPYPTDGTDVVAVHWAKAQTGLSWPAPWDGSIAKQGGAVAPAQPVGALADGSSKTLVFSWGATPNPVDYGNDGHFCLLAFLTKPTSPAFEGFQGPNLNQNVLKLSRVAWRNIHIVPVAKRWLGDMLVSNHTDGDMRCRIAFEIVDASGRPIDPAGGRLLITPQGVAVERLQEHEDNRRELEDLGGSTFRVVDISAGISRLDLRPGDVLPFGLEYVPVHQPPGYAVRAIQLSRSGDAEHPTGGQTFVAGEVRGITRRRRHRRPTRS